MTGLLGLCFARCGGQGWGLGCTGQLCDAEPRLGTWTGASQGCGGHHGALVPTTELG